MISLNNMQNQKGNIGVIVSFIIVAGLIGLVIYSLMHKPIKVDPLEGINNNTVVNSEVKTEEPNTIKEEPVVSQKNNMERTAKNGDTLVMNYTGRLTNGTVFDSNVDPKFRHVEPFEFKLGAGEVIKGWDEGLLGMKVGEKKTLNIPPEKGYGAQAVSTIPANSTLIFDVELVAIK